MSVEKYRSYTGVMQTLLWYLVLASLDVWTALQCYAVLGNALEPQFFNKPSGLPEAC